MNRSHRNSHTVSLSSPDSDSDRGIRDHVLLPLRIRPRQSLDVQLLGFHNGNLGSILTYSAASRGRAKETL